MPLAQQDMGSGAIGSGATTLRRDAEFILLRLAGGGDAQAQTHASLVVATASSHPAPRIIERLKHEYALRDHLEPGWAAKPLALANDHGRGRLVLADPGGELLSDLVGRRWDLG